MSTIKVNKLEQRSGCTATVGGGAGKTVTVDATTVTLGRCGGSVSLASGATQSGFGDPASAVLFCTTAKTSPFTAASKVGYFVNTTGGAVTVTLPSSPSAGDIVAFKDYGGTWNVACKAVTLNRNGSKINGACGDANLNTKNQSINLIYVDGTKGWQDIQDSTAGVTGNITYNVEYLVVAGGAGAAGPSNYGGGGGGAGGYRTATGFSVGTNCGPYPVTVGAGGAGVGCANGTNGVNSVFSTITSAGGGGGGGSPNGTAGQPANSGGSGGGAAYGTGGCGNTPSVSPPQGKDGGTTPTDAPTNYNVSGGGGAGAAGASATSSTSGDGGNGVTSSINTTPTTRAGGGGGGTGDSDDIGSGGTGGGGPGGGTPNGVGQAGTDNTGGGGGGGGRNDGQGGNGGSGIIVIRYKFQ